MGKTPRAENYRAPNGDVVSRRQVENIVARGAGWDSWSEYQRTAQTRQYRKQLEMAVEGNGLPDEPASWRKMGGASSDFSRAYKRFIEEGDPYERRWADSHSTDPNGAWAEMLVVQGYRSADATYDVGDTP